MQKSKSATTAGILGVTLGVAGAHNWYLGKKTLAIIHTVMVSLAVILVIVGMIIEANTPYRLIMYITGRINGWATLCYVLGYLLFLGSAIWGAIEGFILLAKDQIPPRMLGANVAPVAAAPVAPNAAAPAASASPAPAAGVTPSAPVVAAPKQPMSPAAKKKLALGLGIGAGAIVLTLVSVVVFLIILHVDYGESYRAVKDLKSHISDLYTSYDCENVADYVESTYISDKKYNDYVEGCRKLISSDSDLMSKLENSSAVKKDKEIKAQYERFKSAYDAALPNASEVETKLGIYQIWHKYVNAAYDISYSSDSEKKVRDAAAILTGSDIEAFKNYGEGWLEKALAYRTAYRNYWNNSKSTSADYQAYRNARTALEEYEDDNEIDIDELAGFDISGTSKMYDEYRTLYEKISDAYEKHYDDSDDCTKIYDSVYCD